MYIRFLKTKLRHQKYVVRPFSTCKNWRLSEPPPDSGNRLVQSAGSKTFSTKLRDIRVEIWRLSEVPLNSGNWLVQSAS